MTRKIFLALLLILNHSLLYGISQAAHIPDEEHPYGYAYQHEHLHGHLHDHDPVPEPEFSHDHDHHSHGVAPVALDIDNQTEFTSTENNHESHHTHGVHIPLNCDLPFTLSLTLLTLCDSHPASHQQEPASLALAPPVPPPNPL